MNKLTKYRFNDIGENEDIIKIVHRNWFYIFEQFFLILLMFFALAVCLILVPQLFPIMNSGTFQKLFMFVESLLLLGIWIFGFLIWIDYYFDIWIVTTHRIVNIEQQGMFSRKVSEVNYEKVQDVSLEVKGFIPTMLNFGDVVVQTAGEEENFVFRTVSDPYEIKNIIMQQSQNKMEESESV